MRLTGTIGIVLRSAVPGLTACVLALAAPPAAWSAYPEQPIRLVLVHPGIREHKRAIAQHPGCGSKQHDARPPYKLPDGILGNGYFHFATEPDSAVAASPALYPARVRTNSFPPVFERAIRRTLWYVPSFFWLAEEYPMVY